MGASATTTVAMTEKVITVETETTTTVDAPEVTDTTPSTAKEQTSSPAVVPGVVGAAVRPQSPLKVPQATMEEDKVMEIERAVPEPQSVWILRKRGEEVVVVEEENTTREIKRLKSAVAGVMTQIERAHRERDLAESNARDLEHQNGVLSERLTASSEQLKKTSEELAIASEELKKMSEQLSKKNVELNSKTEQLDRKCQQLEDASKLKSEQDAELNRLCQTIEQIRQEKTKESDRADKLAEELRDYRHKTKAQFDVLVQEAKVQKDNFNTITAAIKPVLDYVDVEPTPHPDVCRFKHGGDLGELGRLREVSEFIGSHGQISARSLENVVAVNAEEFFVEVVMKGPSL
ncbi:uncharacterized protein [Miscanthus floridulus]|uniref:uncharacterized protein n=1 Tax=Miscanthus floridulus TaxID=154761 RepID=UPI0034584249